MILQRLYELAIRENLLDDPAFEDLPVPYLITIGKDGKYAGFSDIRHETTLEPKKKGGKPRVVKDKGRVLKVPRAHGNTANQGFARYFVDTLPRVLPLIVEAKDQKKADASRETFWEQITRAAEECDDPALQALRRFGERLPEFTETIRAEVAKNTPAMTDRVTFAYFPSGGRSILEETAIRKWYSAFYAKTQKTKQGDGPVGICQVTGKIGPIPTSHSTKLQGVPGGMSVGVSLISFDKPAFGHYGLDGAVNAGIGFEATDGYLRSLDALLKNAVPSARTKNCKTKFVIGGTAFLCWTKEPVDSTGMDLFDEPADEPLKKLIESIQGGKTSAKHLDETPFYLLALSGNSARAIVRGYLESKLGEVKKNIVQWFTDLRIADTSKDYSGKVNEKFPLWQLALATAFDKDALAPETAERLLQAAITGGPVAESLLVGCLRRLNAEGSEGFRTSRMALIKLILKRREVPVSEKLNPDECHPAYIYGRLLSVFEQIQFSALDQVNATVVDKFYSTFSSSPAMVFSRLQDNARNHLRKLRGEKPGAAYVLEKKLMEICGLLGSAAPPRQFSLQDQGRFALGYYHEKAKRFEEIADRKAEKAANAEKK